MRGGEESCDDVSSGVLLHRSGVKFTCRLFYSEIWKELPLGTLRTSARLPSGQRLIGNSEMRCAVSRVEFIH